MEFASVDPKLRTIFYTLDQEQSGTPRLQRRTTDCVLCHDGASTGGVPGLMVRSVYPDNEGNAILRAGTFFTTDHSPWRERWGGWYVTGTHGDQPHMGNLLAPNHVSARLALALRLTFPRLTFPWAATSRMSATISKVHDQVPASLRNAIDALVRAMFFSDEQRLTGPFPGGSQGLKS